ncbi:MAG: hypothetical protein KKA44_16270 [Alphaproteobacteria bacterium]|nr:hypothetical protein [Alphaproteobacteria bacterium]MBU0863923.1 hypothetical protein [Alphaproteobacteria bacterium]MBU1826514.1 hypothetical protein [Alphaproteobacteria bacterium]
MNINELKALSDWFHEHFSEVQKLYGKLLQPIQHNANQAGKQPLESQLNELIGYLEQMKFDDLSLQQINLLDDLGVSEYIGPQGARFVEGTIRTSEYDPSTAATRINDAINSITQAHDGFQAYRNSLSSLGIGESDDDESDFITIRIGFQNNASINNVTDLKNYSKDWYDIIRGIALAANEAPESTKVVGASTGSIILILAGTASVTAILALISKNIASVTKDIIGIAHQIEDLRGKKLLSSVIEKELKKLEGEKKKSAEEEIINLVSKKIPGIDGEKITALSGSIRKLLTFNEKGGNVDFVAPEANYEIVDENGIADNPIGTLAAAREAIHEYQEIREQIKLLTDQTGQDL